MMMIVKRPVLTILIVGLIGLFLGGCSTAPVQQGEPEPAFFDPERLILAELQRDFRSSLTTLEDRWIPIHEGALSASQELLWRLRQGDRPFPATRPDSMDDWNGSPAGASLRRSLLSGN